MYTFLMEIFFDYFFLGCLCLFPEFHSGVSFLLVTSKAAQHKAGGISGSVSLNGEAV